MGTGIFKRGDLGSDVILCGTGKKPEGKLLLRSLVCWGEIGTSCPVPVVGVARSRDGERERELGE